MTSAPHFPGAQVVRFQAPRSPGGFPGMLAGRPCDPRRFRALYPDRWMTFLHAHFWNHTHVAVFFDVDERTARLWWEGTNAPQGWAVDFAVQSIPAAADWLRAA